MRKNILLLLVAVLISACSTNMVYNCFEPIVYEGEDAKGLFYWHKDTLVTFDYCIDDTASTYTMIIYMRHDERFPYQNMWLFVSDSTQCDTIEFYLADDRGKWLGDKHSGFIEMPVLFAENKQFADTGIYHMAIQQGMRDSLLRGVTDIGLEIIKNAE